MREDLREQALDAAIELLTEEGWDSVTQARVAERSGLGRATIYRYWPNRTMLVHDAVLKHMVVTHHAPPTGDLRTDLLTELNNLRYELTERDLGPVLAALVDRAEWEAELFRIKLEIDRGGRAVLQAIIEEGIERGALVADVDVSASISILSGALLYRRLISGEPVSGEFAEWLVDNFIRVYGTAKTRRLLKASR